MKKIKPVQGIILAVIIFISLGTALIVYFQDLPLLWTITLLVLVAAIGILGYVFGYLFGQQKS